MNIDIRSNTSLYITIGDYIYYIDDSTNEQIVNVYHKEDKGNYFKAIKITDYERKNRTTEIKSRKKEN